MARPDDQRGQVTLELLGIIVVAATTDGEEAFAGGPRSFVDDVRARLAVDEDEIVRDWLEHWEAARRPDFEPDWIADLLEHLYGSERARAWLAGTSFARER